MEWSDRCQNVCNLSIIIECTNVNLNECDIDNFRIFINNIRIHNHIQPQKTRKSSETKMFSKNVIEKIRSHLKLSNQQESNFNAIPYIYFKY